MSIRITDGQSLLSEVGVIGNEVQSVTIELCGPMVAPYPKALTEELNLRDMLSLHGIRTEESDEIVTFGESRNIGYAAPVSKEQSKQVAEWRSQGVEVSFSSPLERCVSAVIAARRRSKNVHLTLDQGIAYVAYAEEMQLRYAEIVPIENEGELVNLLALLNEDYDLKKAQFTLSGSEGKRYYKTLKEYFRRVDLEK